LPKAHFITFEGIEGSGKSTLIEALDSWLRNKNLPSVKTREPGGSELGPKLRSIILDHEPAPETELLLFAADRAEHVRKFIQPNLELGNSVLCDRFTHSSLAYQGYGRGLSLDKINYLNEVATSGLQPDLVIWLDLDIEVALERAKKRGEEAWTRFEREGAAFHQKIRNGYQKMAEEPSSPIKRITRRPRKSWLTRLRLLSHCYLEMWHLKL